MEVSQIGRMNDIIADGKIDDLIKIAEAFHEKKIAAIADDITHHMDTIKSILIAGPTCSGKTTFSKRLDIHLRANGIKATPLSLDNYFVDREDCPKDENGEFDFYFMSAFAGHTPTNGVYISPDAAGSTNIDGMASVWEAYKWDESHENRFEHPQIDDDSNSMSQQDGDTDDGINLADKLYL